MHEDCERLERLVVADFKNDVKGHREKLAQGHRVRRMLDQLQAQSGKLVCGTPQQLPALAFTRWKHVMALIIAGTVPV